MARESGDALDHAHPRPGAIAERGAEKLAPHALALEIGMDEEHGKTPEVLSANGLGHPGDPVAGNRHPGPRTVANNETGMSFAGRLDLLGRALGAFWVALTALEVGICRLDDRYNRVDVVDLHGPQCPVPIGCLCLVPRRPSLHGSHFGIGGHRTLTTSGLPRCRAHGTRS